nr:MAG TPA: hypothetical protein [Caudoviricetes sp.]
MYSAKVIQDPTFAFATDLKPTADTTARSPELSI